MTIGEISALFAIACLAGAINSVAGGGTLLTFPALIAFGIPAIQANATSTLALLVGIGGSLYSYREHLPAAQTWLKTFAPVSLVGGLLGAWLLTKTSEQFFEQLVPFLILFATVLFLFNNITRRVSGLASSRDITTSTAALLQLGVAIYGGYFGAGIGILMLAMMSLLGLHHIHEMNALKAILGALINIVATAYFIYTDLIVWPQALVMIVGATIGYFSGAHFAQKISQKYIRGLVGIIGISLSMFFFWREFFCAPSIVH